MIAHLPAGALLLTAEDLGVVAYAVAAAQRSRRRNGLGPLRRLDALAAALDAARVAATGHADSEPDHTGDAETMTTTEAAQLLGVSDRTARRLAPGLGGRRIGGRWHLDAAAVAEHVAGGAQ